MDLTNRFNRQVNKIAVSLIRQFDEQVSGIEGILKLTLGEPDFNTPEHVKKAAKEAIDANFSHYTGMSGLLDVREAAAYFMKEKYHLTYQPATEILVTVGATEAISASLLAILEQGDKVLLPAPIYPGYEPIITLAGAEPVYLDTRDNDFVLTPEMIEAAMAEHGEQVKAIILNYPSNPTGVTYNRQELQAIADVLKKYDIFVISDEIYSELTYDESHVSIAEMLRDQTILINGLSKSHAMTGWRIGYACGPKVIIEQMLKIHQYAIMCAPTNSQYAAVDALKNGDADVARMREQYNGRRRYLMHAFEEMGLPCFEPFGAFYVFPCIKQYGMSSEEFAERLLMSEKVAVVPGTAFGQSGEGFVRISYAYSLDNLKIALERVRKFVSKLQPKSSLG